MSRKKKKEPRQCYYNPVIVSVDPGKVAGWVLWLDGEFASWGLQPHEDILGIFSLLQSLKPPRAPGPAPLLVIENQYVKDNVRTARILTERRMRWQACAELLGWGVELVAPSTWQSRTIKGYRGLDTKERSMNYVRTNHNEEAPTHDLADAFCIGAYWLQQARIQGHIRN